jgi:hypothetical protein
MSNIKVSCSKIPDAERAFQILSRLAKTENLFFSQDRGLECYILSEVNRKSLLYLRLGPDFFDEFIVRKNMEVGVHLTEVAAEFHQAYQLSHMKLLHVYDNEDGQLVIGGKNPNGIASCKKISPLPVETPHMFDFCQVPHQYSFALDVPSRLFHAQLKKHERSKTLTLRFHNHILSLESDKQHGLISETQDGLTLLPQNIVRLNNKQDKAPLESQHVHVDVKYLSILMRFEKLAQVVRIFLKTGKPVVFEYIMLQHTTDPARNSSVQLRIGATSRERHPYVE